MTRNRTVLAFGASLVLVVAVIAGWLRVVSLNSELEELRSTVSSREQRLSRVSDELRLTRGRLIGTEEKLRSVRRGVGSVRAQAHTYQDCVAVVSNEGEAGPQAVMFAFLEVGDGRQLLIDEAEWYSGEDANREALEDAEIEAGDSVPNDYYIRNEDESFASLTVAQDAVIVTSTVDRQDIPALKCTSWTQFVAALADPEPWEVSLRRSPYWLTVRNSEVVRIVEQYLP